MPNHSSHTNSASTNDTTTFRFGPLVWRTSKERRKTKSHRRDKCNSGDSGIQVELDGADEPMLHTCTPAGSVTSSPMHGTLTATSSAAVRRANSAKVAASPAAAATAAARAKLRRKGSERAARTAVPMRSLSQPAGLDRLAVHAREVRTTAPNGHSGGQSDSDSEDYMSASPNHQHYANHPLHQFDPPMQPYQLHDQRQSGQPSYAEVLYPFRPASEQELRLEQGALVEVLHREPGPWWWGRLKVDAVAESADIDSLPTEGWFPKDFVRLIEPLYAMQSERRQPRLAAVRSVAAAAPTGAPFAEATNCDIRLGERLAVAMDSETATSFKRAASESPPSLSPRPVSMQNTELIRLNVIKELLDTEVNYVNLLAALCQG